jgi:CheY-like chemotaxis protein
MTTSADKKPSILIIDDDQFLLNMYQTKFERSGFAVTVAAGGIEALGKLEGDARPDAILLDIVMPAMDGFEFLEKLRAGKSAKGVPVIVLSNQGGDVEQERAKKLGVAGYIVKASSIPSEVVTETRRILEGRK